MGEAMLPLGQVEDDPVENSCGGLIGWGNFEIG